MKNQINLSELCAQAIAQTGCASCEIISISSDISNVLSPDASSPTYNVICMPVLDSHDVMVGAVLAQRSNMRGKNSSKTIPNQADITVDGIKYTFWINSLEGSYMAAAKFIPFLALSLEQPLYIRDGAQECITALQALTLADKGSYLNNCMSSIGAIMNKNAINSLDALVVAYLSVVVNDHANFQGVMSVTSFEEKLTEMAQSNPAAKTLVEVVTYARKGHGIITKPEMEEGDVGVLRMEFARAVSALVEDFIGKVQEIAVSVSEPIIDAAFNRAELALVSTALKINPALATAKQAYEGTHDQQIQ